jgi:hypothetical protein
MPDKSHPLDTEVLIQKYLSGELSAAEAGELHDRLKATPELGFSLLQQLQTNEMLAKIIGAEKAANHVATDREDNAFASRRKIIPVPAFTRAHPLMWATALAACFMALAAGVMVWRSTSSGSQEPREITTRAVAVLTRAVNVDWASGVEAYYPGAALSPGWLKFNSGLVQAEFFNGARVVLEGPAEFEIVSSRSAFCKSGRLSAEAPPSAHGFAIRTPQLNLVDLGTAFGMTVQATNTEVHVFEGEVRVEERPDAQRSLYKGEAVSICSSGSVREFAANRETFVSAVQLDKVVLAGQRAHHEHWSAAMSRLSTDPSLLIHYDFERLLPLDRTLPNLAKGGTIGDAIIVACSSGQGRWLGKNALEFSGVSSRVLLNVPGEFSSLTFVAWVRVNSLENNYNSLFMCDAFNPGAPHWQILYNGVVRLGVAKQAPDDAAEYDSPVVFTRERFGQWVHLAVTYDASARKVTHYVNSEPVRSQALEFDIPLRFGPIQLGNWNRGDYTADETPIRNFSGRMDEFELFCRALASSEIRQLYQAGVPQSEPNHIAHITR